MKPAAVTANGASIRQSSAISASRNAYRPITATFAQPTVAGNSLVAFVATANTTNVPSGWTEQDPNVAVLTAHVGAGGVPPATTYSFGKDSAVTQVVEVAGSAPSGWLFAADNVSQSSPLSRSLQVPSAGGLMLTAWAGLASTITGVTQSLPAGQTSAPLGQILNSRASGNGESGHLALSVSAITSEPFDAQRPFTASATFGKTGNSELVGNLVWIPPARIVPPPSPTPVSTATGPTPVPSAVVTPTSSPTPQVTATPSSSPTVKPTVTPTAKPPPTPTPTPVLGGKTFWAQIPAQSSFSNYANWLGCSVPMAHVYNDNSSSWSTNFDISAAMQKVDAHVPVMLSLAIYPNSDATGDAGMADIVSGAGDNAMRTAAAQILASDPPAPDGNIYIRIFWETPDVTGTWGNASPTNWKAGFAHVATIFHAASPRFKMVWDIAPWASSSAAQSASYYPGDQFVDVIGQDTYFGTASGEGSVASAWSYALQENGNGLTWLASFAAQHAKPTSIDEWGFDSDNAGPIVTNLANWAKASNTVFVAYFDADWQYANFLESNRFPTASAVYKANACAGR